MPQVNDLGTVRGQLSDLLDIAGKDSTRADIKALTKPLMDKVIAVERKLYQMQVTGRGQDNVRWPVQITEQLTYLSSSIGSSDYAPTAAQKEVAQSLHDRLVKVKVEAEQLLKQDVPAFNESIRGKSVHPIISSEN